MQSTVEPSGADSQTFNAPANVAPPEVPVKIPSCVASSRSNRSLCAVTSVGAPG